VNASSKAKVASVLVVEDHPVVAQVLGAIARSVFGEAVVGFAGSVAGAIDGARAAGRPDLVLLDLGLPDCAGLQTLTRVRDAFPQARVVVVSGTEERAVVLSALEAGAAGYIPKTLQHEVIAAALRLVAAGGIYVPMQAIEADRGPAASAAGSIGLTCRQLEVLRLIVRGLANKEIAQDLRIAKETVKQHAKAVYAALGVTGRAQAGRAAERRGIKFDR